MQRITKYLTVLIAFLMVFSVAFATAPTVTVLDTGKQQNSFYFDLETNLDSNCIADWNNEKTTWEDMNGSDGAGIYYMTGTAGTNHGIKATAGEGYTERTIRYCCAETTYGQTNANATCAGVGYTFYYGAEAIAESGADVLVGSLASIFSYISLLAILIVVIIAIKLGFFSKGQAAGQVTP